jgi:hypothetical protein
VLVSKLYWPMPVWTIPAALGLDVDYQQRSAPGRFACRKCWKLVYESSETHWRPDNRNDSLDIFWDRFVQRLTLGLLRGRDVPPPEGVVEEMRDAIRNREKGGRNS